LSRRPTKPAQRARRAPKQERSAKRREDILDATGRLLQQVGYEATNTTAIAKEAGTSVGSVYEYFPNRDALIRALLERYRARLNETIAAALHDADPSQWRSIASRAVDTFADFYRLEPGYRVLWLESQSTPALREAGVVWGDELGVLIESVLGPLLSHLSATRRRVVARTCMHLVSSLTSMALIGPEALIEPTLTETKRALEAYLDSVIATRAAR